MISRTHTQTHTQTSDQSRVATSTSRSHRHGVYSQIDAAAYGITVNHPYVNMSLQRRRRVWKWSCTIKTDVWCRNNRRFCNQINLSSFLPLFIFGKLSLIEVNGEILRLQSVCRSFTMHQHMRDLSGVGFFLSTEERRAC